MAPLVNQSEIMRACATLSIPAYRADDICDQEKLETEEPTATGLKELF